MYKLTEFVSSLSHVLNRLINIISWRHLFTCCPAIYLLISGGCITCRFLTHSLWNYVLAFMKFWCFKIYSFNSKNTIPKKRKEKSKKQKRKQNTRPPHPPPQKKSIAFFSFSDVRRYTVRYKPNLYRWPH